MSRHVFNKEINKVKTCKLPAGRCLASSLWSPLLAVPLIALQHFLCCTSPSPVTHKMYVVHLRDVITIALIRVSMRYTYHVSITVNNSSWIQNLEPYTGKITIYIYRLSQGEWARLRENVPYVKVHRYNPKHLYPKMNGYGDNGERILKVWQLLHTYWLPNTY